MDADAFFASVEQAADSRLRGRAMAVGGEKRGIIASASYEARKMGVYTPMPTARARKLCPELIVVPGDYEKYEHFSKWMFSYAYDFTPTVEISSIDEGYFDLSGVRGSPIEIAQTIRKAIRQALKISVSEGLGSSKLVSQIASKLRKPDAFVNVSPGQEKAFLHPLSHRWLPGIGPKTACRLQSAGLMQIGQIAAMPLDLLSLLLGKAARQYREFADGIDDRPIVPERQMAKSYSHQRTFREDVTDEEWIEAVLRGMADDLMRQVRGKGRSIRTLEVRVRYNDMAEDRCSESLMEPTDLETDLYGRLRQLLKKAWRRRVSLRMVSLKFSNIYDGFFRSELDLNHEVTRHENRRRLARVVDELRRTQGDGVIRRGHDFILADAPGKVSGLLRRGASPVRVVYPVPEGRKRRPALPKHYVPLAVHSGYSFLDSTLTPERMVGLAVRYDLPSIALTDHGNLHGATEFVEAARNAGIHPILGTVLGRGPKALYLYVQNQVGYRNLCRLINAWQSGETGNHEISDFKSKITNSESCLSTDGLLAAAADPCWADHFSGRFYRAVENPCSVGQDVDSFSPSFSNLPCAAVQPVHYAELGDRKKYNIIQSIRTLTLLEQAHPEKRMKGDYHFRSPLEMRRLFADHGDCLAGTLEIAERCREFEFPFGPPQFPEFRPPDGSSPREFLRRLVFQGLNERYGPRAKAHREKVEQELKVIHDVGYEEYFLVVWDILQECRRQGIHWITRGSAADSLVCFCLRISGVCPVRFELYFQRFLNKERMQLNKLPDIDVDFPHDRKDDVIDILFKRYGVEHAAVVGGFSTFQARSAVADIAKVLGVSEYQIRRFTEKIPRVPASDIVGAMTRRQECRDLDVTEEPYATALETAAFLDGFPRYPKMHPCGVVLSRQPIADLTPVFTSTKGYPTTHFDMDALEAVGLIKMDILAQGGLAVMRDVEEMLAVRHIEIDLEKLDPWEDVEIWEMIADGGSRAVHHIESPAMVSLCRMCQVRDIDGLIAIVSVIRPGAANEQKKVRFARRYCRLEPVEYPHPSLSACLRSTYGMVVYEEHILQICEVFSGLPGGRADVLRRALNREKHSVIEEIREEFFEGAVKKGRSKSKIDEVWNLMSGFQGYAFCKAHSTAYGVEAYQSAWLKYHYPTEFMAAVLSNGKGFYSPMVYALEVLRLGISFLPPCVNDPGPGFQVRWMEEGEPKTGDRGWRTSVRERGGGFGIRVPAVRVKGLTRQTEKRMIEERKRSPFSSLTDFYGRVRPSVDEMESLIRAGAFDRFGKIRTALFWEFQIVCRSGGRGDVVDTTQGWLLSPISNDRLPEIPLQEPDRLDRLKWECELLSFPVSGHPLELFPGIAWNTYCPIAELKQYLGQMVVVCGLVIQDRIFNQTTGETMKFLSIADWTGMIETELFAKTYRAYGLNTVRYPVLEITARVEPFATGNGFSLRVHHAGKPREVKE